MDRKSVASSNISSIGYDDKRLILEVEFVWGAIYQYSNIPGEVASDLMCANSKGRYFNDHIRGRYLFRRVQ